MTNDDDLPAGVTRSMHNRQMDNTRTASAPAGSSRNAASPPNTDDEENTQEENESTSDSDTLGGAPKR